MRAQDQRLTQEQADPTFVADNTYVQKKKKKKGIRVGVFFKELQTLITRAIILEGKKVNPSVLPPTVPKTRC